LSNLGSIIQLRSNLAGDATTDIFFAFIVLRQRRTSYHLLFQPSLDGPGPVPDQTACI